jgi:hypothetical protein
MQGKGTIQHASVLLQQGINSLAHSRAEKQQDLSK